MTVDELRKACADFETEHGIEGFLDAMATIMQERLARHGLPLQFFDDEEPSSLDNEPAAAPPDRNSYAAHR
jgi:hypothetical protein